MTLAVAVLTAGARADAQTLLDIRAGLDSSAGYTQDATLSAGEWEAAYAFLFPGAVEPDGWFPGLSWGLPSAGWGLSGPWLTVGCLEPAGLAAFVLAPAAASFSLLSGPGRPFALDVRPEPGLAGLCAGSDGGIFHAADGKGAWYGAWAAPPDAGLGLLVAAEEAAVVDGGPSWYEPPLPAARRLWAGVAALLGGGTAIRAGGAAAGFWSWPGSCSWAVRAELDARMGRVGTEAVVSAAGPGWEGPGRRQAPAWDLDAGLWAKLPDVGIRLSLDARRDSWSDMGVSRAITAAVDLPKAAARVEASSSPTGMDTLTLDWSVRPLPWLGLRGAWKAANGRAERLDLGLKMGGGSSARWSLEADLRLDSDGRWLKLRAGVQLPRDGRGRSWTLGLSTDGWRSLEPGTGAWLPAASVFLSRTLELDGSPPQDARGGSGEENQAGL